MAQSGETTERDLDVIPKALLVIAANLVMLLFFFFGTTDVREIGPNSHGLLKEGTGGWVGLVFALIAATSLLMAAIALLGLLTPWDVPRQPLRAAGGLLGAAILALAAVFSVASGGTNIVGLSVTLVIMVVIGSGAWWIARRITQHI